MIINLTNKITFGELKWKKLKRQEARCQEILEHKKHTERLLREKTRIEKATLPLPDSISSFLNSINIFRQTPMLGQIAYNIRNNTNENLFFLKENGAIIDSLEGNEDSVAFCPSRKHLGSLSVHNHPSAEGHDIPPSARIMGWSGGGDIPLMHSVKSPHLVVSNSKALYVMSQPENIDSTTFNKSLDEVCNQLNQKQDSLCSKIKSPVEKEYQAEVFKYLDELWHTFARRIGGEYLHLKWPI